MFPNFIINPTIILTLLLLVGKMVGMNISWIVALSPLVVIPLGWYLFLVSIILIEKHKQ